MTVSSSYLKVLRATTYMSARLAGGLALLWVMYEIQPSLEGNLLAAFVLGFAGSFVGGYVDQVVHENIA